MRPSAALRVPAEHRDLYNFKRGLPRMSWSGPNLYNLWSRSNTRRRDTEFGQSSATMFQQRWKAKRFLQAYHFGGFIPTKQFERWYLPDLLPAIHSDRGESSREATKWIEGKENAGGRYRDEREAFAKAARSVTPVTSMMFALIERRLDVCIFRACFASSVHQARQFVVAGHVKLNGQVITNSATRLEPGDIFTVNPKAIPFLRQPLKTEESFIKPDVEASAQEEVDAKASSETSDSAESSTPSSAEPTETSASSQDTSGEESSASSTSTPSTSSKSQKSSAPAPTSWFELPAYAQASIFVPAYLLPSYLTCSAVYVRHPTARPGYSEIPSPYDAGGDIMALGWEWWRRKATRMRPGKLRKFWDPQRTKDRLTLPRSRV